MAFQLPVLSSKGNDLHKQVKDLPTFKWEDLDNKEQVTQGAYGVVFTANYNSEQVIIKKMIGCQKEEKFKFVKEARLLKAMQHKNVVLFKGISIDPLSAMLEYVYFDFAMFMENGPRVSSLEDFLSCIDDFNAVDQLPVQAKIATDIATGLNHLHQAGCYHRDLKSANILISNNHYCSLKDKTAVAKAFQSEALVAKLADFGESRAKEIRTQIATCTRTKNVKRGTPAYMAPEIMASDNALVSVNSKDLEAIDIWAFGMVMYVLVNPDITYPYQLEMIQSSTMGPYKCIQDNHRRRNRPTPSQKYLERQKKEWSNIVKVYKECTEFVPSKRCTLSRVFELLQIQSAKTYEVVPFHLHQGSAIEQHNLQLLSNNQSMQRNTVPVNDGTNSCAFLCLLIGNYVMQKKGLWQGSIWTDIARKADNIINTSPLLFNKKRNISQLYDCLGAYSILNKEHLMGDYDFTEEILSGNRMCSESGKVELKAAIQTLKNGSERGAALYTCDDQVIMIGFLEGQLFVADTHACLEINDGKRAGCLTIFTKHENEVMHFCNWLLKRFRNCEKPQSLSLMIARKSNSEAASSCENESVSKFQNKIQRAEILQCTTKEIKDRSCPMLDMSSPEAELAKSNMDKQKAWQSQENSMSDSSIEFNIKPLSKSQKDRLITQVVSSTEDESYLISSPSKRQKILEIVTTSDDSKNGNGDRYSAIMLDSDSSSDAYINDWYTDKEYSHSKSLQTTAKKVIKETSGKHRFAPLTRLQVDVNKSQETAFNESSDMINGVPVYKEISRGLTTTEILDICITEKVNKKKICQQVPFLVDRSSVFVVDLSVVNKVDITADEGAIYSQHSCPTIALKPVLGKDRKVLSYEKIEHLSEHIEHDGVYLLRRQYSWHSSKEYKRIIIKVERDSEVLRLAIIQYIIGSELNLADVFNQSMGNSKSGEPYTRTKPSVLANIRDVGKQGSAKHIITQLQNNAGGAEAIRSPSEIPRNRDQVYKQMRKIDGRVKSRNTGPGKAPNLTKLFTMQLEGSFVKDVKFTVKLDKEGRRQTAPNTFAASDLCLGWVKRFCSGTNPIAVAGIDMTYKLGPFYLTTLTLPNPMFVYQCYQNKHPTTLASITTSVTKEKRDYLYMARCLEEQGITSLTYGMDGECAMEQGFEEVYPIEDSCKVSNIHLRCFDHVKDDIYRKLKHLKINEAEKRNITDEILGKEFEGKRVKGLVDCESVVQFDQSYMEKSKEWPKEFNSWMKLTQGRSRSLVDTIKLCMLKPVRIAAGLGDPPNKWSNQRTESLNNIIKEEAQLQVCDQGDIHEIIERNVFKQQESEYIKAIYCTGEYRLSPRFKKYAVSAVDWSKKTIQQRQHYIKKILNIDVTTPGSLLGISNDEKSVIKLTVSIQQSAIDSVPFGLLNEIWEKAETILTNYKIIELDSGGFCITGYAKSHDVSVDNGIITCACRTFNSTCGLCPHALVVAETMDMLPNYLKKFVLKRSKAGKLLQANIPKRAGEKPRDKKKRKGKNNIKLKPIVFEVFAVDDKIDFQKPFIFKEIWHNKNDFNVVFTKDIKRTLKCESCKIEFPVGGITCIPHDIAVEHKERYHYRPINANGEKQAYVATYNKEGRKFYCPKKSCILERHSYFWKGMLKIEQSVRS